MPRLTTSAQRSRLALLLASGAPIDLAREPGFTQQALASAMAEVDVLFRDFGVGAVGVVRDFGEPDSRGFVAEIDVAASVEIPDRAGSIVKIRAGTKEETIWDPWLGESVVTPGGFMVDNFMDASGPVLWAHNREEQLPPVGNVTKAWQKQIDTKAHGKRWAQLERIGVRVDEDLPISRTIARLASRGSLKTVSVGFARVHVDFVKDEAARKKHGLGPGGVRYLTNDQAELSWTPTPMNPLAMTLAEQSAESLVERSVYEGLDVLRREGVLSLAEHSEIKRLLLPMSGDARAAAKVGSFVDFGRCVRATGLWPARDDASPETRAAARARVQARPGAVAVVENSGHPEVEPEAQAVDGSEPSEAQPEAGEAAEFGEPMASVELAAISDGRPTLGDRDAIAFRDVLQALGNPLPADAADVVAGMERRAAAQRERADGLAEEVRSLRAQLVTAQQESAAAAQPAGGILTGRETELVWAALEDVSKLEASIAELLDSVQQRRALSENELAGAVARGTTSGQDETLRVFEPLIQRIVSQVLSSTGAAAPATRHGLRAAAVGDRADVGAAGRAAVRATASRLTEALAPD